MSIPTKKDWKERGNPCSFLTFRDNQLEKIHLSPGDSGVHFSESHPKQDEILEWFQSYQAGMPLPFPLPLNLKNLSLFTQKVLTALREVKFGEVISYGELARKAGYPKAARAVGNACNRNPYPLVIPCHRVIQSNGKIGGFAYDIELKGQLLRMEENLLRGK